MSDTGLTDLDRMMIEWSCTRLVNQFALYNDASDYENLVSLLTEDAVFARPTQPDKPMKGRQTVLEQFRLRPPRTLRHAMVSTVITVESATSATGVCYIVLYGGPPKPEGEPGAVVSDPAMIGTFHDRFVKQGGAWLFAERQGSLELKTAQ